MSVYKRKRRNGTNIWYYDFVYEKVRYRDVGGTNRTQALRVQEKIRSKVISGTYDLEEKSGNIKIGNFAEIFLERRRHLKSHKRIKILVAHLLSYFKDKSLLEINPNRIQDYISKRLHDGVSNATINRELACLKNMFNLAIKWKEAIRNPVNDVEFLKEPPGRTRFLYEEEVQRLLSVASKHLIPNLITALNTGMRLSEILTLKWSNVHIASVIDPYIELGQTKNNKKRFIPLNDDMINLLQTLEKKEDDFVFHGRYGNPIKGIKDPWHNSLRKAGIQNFRFHDLRHTFASHFIMKGGDLLTLKEFLGHSSLKMVERYTHLAAAYKRRQINVLNGSFTTPHRITTTSKVAANDMTKIDVNN